MTRLQIVETELMPAIAASHMIAALVLVHCYCAFGTIYGSSFFLPLLKLYIFFSLSTFMSRMRFHSAGEADASLAIGTDHIFLFLIRILAHVALTLCLGAPPQARIQVNHGVSLKAPVFGK